MTRRIVTTIVILIGLVAFTPRADASTAHLQHAASVVKSSSYTSVWHQPHRGYLLGSVNNTEFTRVLPEPQALAHCHGDSQCRQIVLAYYQQLGHDWRVLNRNLWVIAGVLPRCSNTVVNDCVWRGHAAVKLSGRQFVAQQRARFVHR